MYKIFYENKALILPNINEKEVFSAVVHKKNEAGKLGLYNDRISNWLNNKGLDILDNEIDDVEILSQSLESIFRLAPAAGGVVCQDNSFVAIVRNGVPDLPKGHIEKGETPSVAALREVEEETGIGCGNTICQLPTTWHCYQLEGRWVLKQTFWYEMRMTGILPFTPQREEGITEVRMIDKDGIDAFLNKTYRSLSEILGPNLRSIVAK